MMWERESKCFLGRRERRKRERERERESDGPFKYLQTEEQDVTPRHVRNG
jgi:hypothetical protein